MPGPISSVSGASVATFVSQNGTLLSADQTKITNRKTTAPAEAIPVHGHQDAVNFPSVLFEQFRAFFRVAHAFHGTEFSRVCRQNDHFNTNFFKRLEDFLAAASHK